MAPLARIACVLLALAAGWTADANGEKRTVCSITINSEDERETFRRHLPRDKYRFVELVEKGRTDWLASACQRQVRCDVLVVSGHYNAGGDYYSDQLENAEYLSVSELERASCSASCPALFSNLEEVYLFGCETLNHAASKYTAGESARDRMRRIFHNVPVIYGFPDTAPVGPIAAGLLSRYLASPGGALFTGRPSPRLLATFSRHSMIHTSGLADGDRHMAYRHKACQFADDRVEAAAKLAFVHRMVRADPADAQLFLDRIEKLLAEARRDSPAFHEAMENVRRDRDTRDRYLAFARANRAPAVRARMILVAEKLGWLSAQERAADLMATIGDMLASSSMGFAEVDLVCTLNRGGDLDGERGRLDLRAARAGTAVRDAALACLGSREAHGRTLSALASPDERDVQIAQVYLRHRPIRDPGELRSVARDVARMNGGSAQVRALDTLARLHIADREILSDLARSFADARSASIQRALAEVFLRSDGKALPRSELSAALRQHGARAGRDDLFSALLRKLETSS